MTPSQFLGRLKRNELAPLTLFLGQEFYSRARCRQALLDGASAKVAAQVEQLDASEISLAAILDDARSMSLFASERLIFVGSAEAAVPRSSRAAAAVDPDEDDDGGGAGSADSQDGAARDAAILEAWAKSPVPGVNIIFEATRWDLDGEDRARSERVRKYFSAIRDVVEFRRFSPAEARAEVDRIAKNSGIQIDAAASQVLVDALASDMGRIAVELEKLALYGKPITAADLALLVPDARQSTIFALVDELGRKDRSASLEALDALVREGEYLPLALSFLATQFRMALVAKESNLRGAGQIQGHFQKSGVQMWGSRAEQVSQTAAKFSRQQLERGLTLIFHADRDLRSARPDDRTVLENFVVNLCS